MLSVVDARRLILAHCRSLPACEVPLSAALGRVLAEDVAADLDMPPFDKALMDGYAVRSADLASGQTVLAVVDEITAGRVPSCPVGPGQASRIMTGAPIPEGADAVVPVERSRLLETNQVKLEGQARSGDNLLRRGREMRRGEVIVRAGCLLRPQEIGMLATLGRPMVQVVPAPRVAVLATGDELIEPHQTPGPGQIRNSNAAMLVAQAARAGAVPCDLGIGRDSVESLRPLIQEGLESAAVLVLSGGVSAGKLDLVPGVLQELGVVPHFHKVHLKPGKPVFFGTADLPPEAGGEGGKSSPARLAGPTLVFGLPGNPVSSLVCFELFLRPALLSLAGRPDDPAWVRARLAVDFPYRTDRPTYHPARLHCDEQGWSVQPVPWFGSADLRAFLDANALLVLPEGDQVHRAGQLYDVLRLDSQGGEHGQPGTTGTSHPGDLPHASRTTR
jgi:molybdopterin molybdotransferase